MGGGGRRAMLHNGRKPKGDRKQIHEGRQSEGKGKRNLVENGRRNRAVEYYEVYDKRVYFILLCENKN